MYVKTITKFETDRLDGDSTLAIALRIDLDEIVQEAGARIWDHLTAKEAADYFGTDLLEDMEDAEVLDAYGVEEKCESVEADEVAEWLANEGYTVAAADEDMVMVPRATLEALRTVVGAASGLLEELD